MHHEYQVSEIDKLIPTKSVKWALLSTLPVLSHAIYALWMCVHPVLQSKPAELNYLWQVIASLSLLLVIAFFIILHQASIIKNKKHSVIYHYKT
jgi:hypothetical protein